MEGKGARRNAIEPAMLITQVGAAIGAGLGVLGFVILVGGALAWARFEEAGLSPSAAVAVVPREVHVATGAQFLLPAALLSLAAVAILVFYYWFLTDVVAKSVGAAEREVDEADRICRDLAKRVGASTEAVLHAQRAHDHAQDTAREAAGAALAAARGALGEAERDLAAAEADRRAKALRSRRLSSKERRFQIVVLAASLWVGQIFFTGWSGADLDAKTQATLLLVSGITVAIACGVLARTRSLLWFGVAAFVAIGFFSALVTYERTQARPKLEPTAVLRAGKTPALGFLVAQTGDRVYLGVPSRDDDVPATMLTIPNSEIADVAVGPLTPIEKVPSTAVEIALAQCATIAESAQSFGLGRAAARRVCGGDAYLLELAELEGD